MTAQYLRNLSLVVANPSGKGLDLGAFRCVFNVIRGDIQTPNSCDVRVYNLSDSTANTINTEFTQLALKVSYGSDPPQLIFRGSVKQVRKGREDQRNSYVALTAADGDEAYNFSAMARTLAAGSTPKNAIEAIVKQMSTASAGSPTGTGGGQTVSLGYLPNLSQNKSVRGATYYGMCRDELRSLAENNGCTWSIQDGKVQLVPLTGYIPGEAVLITPATGLIGVPEQTQNGLELQVLLNPGIKIGQTIKLQSTDVNQFRYGLDVNSSAINSTLAASVAKLNADGLYYVMRAEHQGDTRGNAWYTHLTCLAIDSSVPRNAEAFTPSGVVNESPRDAIKRY